MEDKEFLELLKNVGFTPTFYVDEQYDIDYYLEDDYNLNGIVEQIKIRIEELKDQKDIIKSVPSYNHYKISPEVNAINNEICKLEEELIKSILKSAGEFEVVEEEGGSEGNGESYHLVLYFKDFDKYVRSDGKYYSYEGVTDLSDWRIVTPREKTIIVYE